MSYQVFLSFKNTDNGVQTKDSVIGAKLYNYLAKKGVNVFFSNVSLLEFGEAAYKDAIDDALDEVQLMVVIGSTPEFLNSQWCKYEWQNYQQNILSNIVQGNLITYLGDMNLAEVPMAIRHYQSFKMEVDSVERVGDFIIKNLEKNKPEETKEKEIANQPKDTEFIEKKASSYNVSWKGELKRLSLSAKLTKEADAKPLKVLKEKLKERKKIYVLDVGCGNGMVTMDRFANWDNAFVLGVDVQESALEKARELNSNPKKFAFERLDIDSPDFIEELEELMDKYDIEGFDLIFGTYILQHIKDSIKFLRKARQILKDDGYVMFRNTADKSTISFGDNGLLKKIQNKSFEAPGVPDRDTGIELYHRLYTTGYKNIKVFGHLMNISGLDYDERMEAFRVLFAWRKNYFKQAYDNDPLNLTYKNNYEWMSYALDRLQEIFGDESFWYGETIICVIATKK